MKAQDFPSFYDSLPETDDPSPIPQQQEKDWVYWSMDGTMCTGVNVPHYASVDLNAPADLNASYWRKWRSRWCKSFLWHTPHPDTGECIFCGFKGPFK